jgi:rubrerythrin
MRRTLRGSRTEKNLATAFAGESMARTRYVFFARAAQQEGFEQIASIFLETAANEKEHAKKFLKLMKGENNQVHVQFNVPGIPVGKTAENLRAAANSKLEDHSRLYPRFAQIATDEGFTEIARIFGLIATIEAQHEQRFRLLLKQVEQGTVFKRDREVLWKCRNCGYVSRGTEAPAVCPACGHQQGWYQVKEELE